MSPVQAGVRSPGTLACFASARTFHHEALLLSGACSLASNIVLHEAGSRRPSLGRFEEQAHGVREDFRAITPKGMCPLSSTTGQS